MSSSENNNLEGFSTREIFLAFKATAGFLVGLITLFGIFIPLTTFGFNKIGFYEIFSKAPKWSFAAFFTVAALVFPKISSELLRSIGAFLSSMADIWKSSQILNRLCIVLCALITIYFPLAGLALLIYIEVFISELKKINFEAEDHDSDRPPDEDDGNTDPYA